ncbi:hypothetical protein EXIGLDRAFT_717036 [Exidia glandulosa HHB12029]|uniref:Protein kinase domain-containing protein n=1 Tax=Exidia glandulosa HHB12029 TaxID=1314781 RepID=A0A166AN00_EXIGL|nr:hypothetical protein EXIGLDRAFT_717036 [Exidia glandulosa HHB12029]
MSTTPSTTPPVAPAAATAAILPAPNGLTPLKPYLAANPRADRRSLLQQIGVQLAVFHAVDGVIHGDVKMTSVFVDERGVAHLPKSKTTVSITSLPRAPRSPEERLPMTTATDVYAFAWLVFHVYTDIDPQELAREPKMMRMIASGVKPNRPGPGTLPTQRGLSDTIWAMLLRCLEISPAARPPITEVLHAFDAPPPPIHPPPPPPYEEGTEHAQTTVTTSVSDVTSSRDTTAEPTPSPEQEHATSATVDRQRETGSLTPEVQDDVEM